MLELLTDVLLDTIIDTIIDTAKLIPFLFITYCAMEALEHSTSDRLHETVARAGAAGPVIGAAVGAIPQCGFSAMAATLYSGGVVSVGTLIAVLLSTSDEMLPVFAAHAVELPRILSILGIKVVAGLLAGLFCDLALHVVLHTAPDHHIHDLCEREDCGCDDEFDGAEHGHDHAHNHTHNHDHAAHSHAHTHGHNHAHGGSVLGSVIRSAFVHTAQVTIFIFVASLILGLVVEGAGEDVIADFLGSNPVTAIFLAGLFGLIPNCAASVVISELFLTGTLSTPAMLAGLLVSGGTGLLVLYRTNPNARENLTITALTYIFGVGAGLIASFAGIVL